jgi:phage N-6-adenine-methyltransferase
MPSLAEIATEKDRAARINEAHRLGNEAAYSALKHYRHAGVLLKDQKASLPHGQWLKWLAENVVFCRDTAAKYMRVAERWDELNAERVLHLSFRQALELLAVKPDETPEEPADQVEEDPELQNPPEIFGVPVWFEEHQDDAPTPTNEAPPPEKPGHLNVLLNDSVEWYTPPTYIDAAREVMGGFDIDPASNDTAQAIIQAETYYTEETNGLDKEWRGRLWLNPPWGDECRKFVAKAVSEFEAGNVTEAILLLNSNSNETSWFAPLWDHTLCFTKGRINFYAPSGEASGSTHGSCFVYLGENIQGFAEVFKQFGAVVRRIA